MTAAATAVGGLVAKSISSYADYEQLIGGVDTLFKDSSAKVQEYAKNAFKTAGMSANEYMETVTGFSASLIQSLGGDTAAAADKANMALIDMSDNANKMGSDMESIKNAYSGFAKQNYTMLDNLKLGYGGTKEEMQRLLEDAQAISGVEYDVSSYADVVDAIHVIQTEMGITGTTAKEASSTISGSLSSMKAAWSNVVTAISSNELPFDEYLNTFIGTVSTFGENIIPRIEIALQGVVKLVDQLAPIIIDKLPGIVSKLLPSIIQTANNLLNSVIAILPDLISSLLPAVLQGLVDMIQALISAFPQIISALMAIAPDLISAVIALVNVLVENMPTMIEAIVAALPTLIPQLVDGIVSMIVTLCNNFAQIIQPIIDYLPEIIISITDALLNNLPVLIKGLITLVTAIVQALPQIFSGLVEGVKYIFNSLWEGIKQIFAPVGEWFSNLWGSLKENPALTDLCEHIENLWNGTKEILSGIFTFIKTIITIAWENIKVITSAVFEAVKNNIMTIWNSIKNTISTVINAVKNVISTAWNAIKTIIKNVMNIIFSIIKGDWTSVKNSISNILNAIKSVISSVWEGIKSVISSVLSGIKATISSVWNGIKSTISSVVSSIKNTVSSNFNSLKSSISSIWSGIKTAMTKPIETARDTIKGIVDKIKGFFTGMKLEFPNIKLPHFSISPSGWKIGDLLEGSIPKLGIEWYAKAMNNPMLMTEPTIFGYNPSTGQLMGGGEKGAEVVAGANPLMAMIQTAVAAQMNGVSYYLQQLISMLAEYFPQVIENAGHDIFLDSRQLAVGIAEPINAELGKISARKGRGR